MNVQFRLVHAHLLRRRLRSHKLCLRTSAAVLLTLAVVVAPCRGESKQSRAEDLVQSALSAELAGDDARHAELLEAADAIAPRQPEVQWQQGRVLFEGAWRTPEYVAGVVNLDPRRDEYQHLRGSAPESLEYHRQLADWCARNDLPEEERYHRTAILWQQPDDRDSQRRLGLQPFRGGLATREQIDAELAAEKQRQLDLRKYGRQFDAWVQEALAGNGAERAEVFGRFAAVRDTAAIPALRQTIRMDDSFERGVARRLGSTAAANDFRRDLSLAIVSAVRAMPQHAATQLLAEWAIHGDEADLRAAAAAGLRDRRPTDYMPMMMAAMQSPVEVDVQVEQDNSGTVRMTAVYRQEGAEADRSHVERLVHSTISPTNVQEFTSVRFEPTVARQWQLANQAAAQRQEVVAAQNEQRLVINDRAAEAFQIITGHDLGSDPAIWRQQWADFNDLFIPEDRPTEASEYNDYRYTYIRPPVGFGGMSCFAAGTPVWTNRGPTPIELITPGELVLSQNPLTGELAYRPVMQTTVRPPTAYVALTLPGGEVIRSTRGHRFWVVGEGWCMAKFLQPQLRLVGAGDALEISAVDEFDGEDAFNLVVDDFHTYFVGRQKVLVHDNSCPQPTLAPIPGMKSDRSVETLASQVYGAGAPPKLRNWSE